MAQAAVAEEFAGLMLHAPTPEAGGRVRPRADESRRAAVATSILVDQTFRDYRELLPEITVPTLVAFGGDDKGHQPGRGQADGRWIPGHG